MSQKEKNNNEVMEMDIVKEFQEQFGAKILCTNKPGCFFKEVLRLKPESLLVTSNLHLQKIATKMGKRSLLISEMNELAMQLLALREVFLMLNQKGVACYMFNRISTIDKDYYTKNARKRILHKNSFPKMYKNIEKYEKDFKELFGELYSVEYVKEIGKITQVVKHGEIFQHEDMASEYINIIAGNRVVPALKYSSQKKIHVFGRCGVFGYAVEDKDTFPNKLQELVNEHNGEKYCIVNHGLWGGEDNIINHNIIMEAEKIEKGDIVIIYMRHYAMNVVQELAKCGLQYYNITKEYHKYPESQWCFYDRPGHMTKVGYSNLAKIIYNKLLESDFLPLQINKGDEITGKYIEKYCNNQRDEKFVLELKQYLSDIANQYPLKKDSKNGAIVMNCNPFTKGHRYLIEYASQKVDRLYVFVLEEDKSFFKFCDRFNLVKMGTQDISNVIVLPSKEFMISAMTFPDYFMKDYVQEKEIDVTKDLSIFCEYIAKELNISVRFVGEEPIDMITKQYNENMKKILPQYGLELCEIPRLSISGENVISASKVRKLLKENNYEEIRDYVPKTTYDYLIANYTKGNSTE